MLKFCENCRKKQTDQPFKGYYPFLYDNDYECPDCKSKLLDTCIDENEYITIAQISKDILFLEAMIKLKQDDIIEYQSRMNQFKIQLQQEESTKVQSNNNLPHCPRCGSASITAGQRGYSLLTGFIGSGKTVNRCSNCGYKWKP